MEEIVEFQRSIGVDIATMLDVFSRPDMSEDEVLQAVQTTIERCEARFLLHKIQCSTDQFKEESIAI